MRIPLTEAKPVTLGGIEALYQPHEQQIMRGILLRSDSGGYAPGDAQREVEFLHSAKALLGATILAEDDPWRNPPMTAISPSSDA